MNLMKLLLPNIADVSNKVEAEELQSHTGRHNDENGDAVLTEPISCFPGNSSDGTIYGNLNWNGVCDVEFCVLLDQIVPTC
jgi:hypothetical protein